MRFEHTMNAKVSDLVKRVSRPAPEPTDVRVTGVRFLTPAKVTLSEDGRERTVMVGVDIASRSAYDEDGDESPLTEKIFDFLSDSHAVPSDFYAAPDEIGEKAGRINAEREKINAEITEVANG